MNNPPATALGFQINLTQLNLVVINSPVVRDPRSRFVHTTPVRPPATPPTEDPHRYTISVPHFEGAVFSIGQACANYINDFGITGKTETHIHWEVKGEHKKTILSLGGGSTDTGFKSAFDATVPGSGSSGFSMVTEQKAFLNSKEQFFIVADQGDIQVRACAGHIALTTDAEDITLQSAKGVTVGANGNVKISATQEVFGEDKRYLAKFESAVGVIAANKGSKLLVKAGDVAKSALGLFQAIQGVNKRATEGKTGWENTGSWDKAKIITDSVKFVSTVGRTGSDLLAEKGGKVGISADTYASITGGTAAGMYGGLSASITSLLSASVVGGTASLTGLAWASVFAGIGASVKSLKDVGLEGQFGNAKVKGKKKVEIECGDGPINVTGKTAQLNANEGATYIHSPKSVVCVAGADAGFGFVSSTTKYAVGVIDSGAGKFSSASVNLEKGLLINKSMAKLQYGSTSKLEITDGAIELFAKSAHGFKVSGSNAEVKSKGKILIG